MTIGVIDPDYRRVDVDPGVRATPARGSGRRAAHAVRRRGGALGRQSRPSAIPKAASSSMKAKAARLRRDRCAKRPLASRPNAAELRPVGSGKLAGQPLPRLDLPAKSDGSMRFAADVRLPRMIFASVRMAPPGGQLTGFSQDAARRQQGLIELVVRDRLDCCAGRDLVGGRSRARPRRAPLQRTASVAKLAAASRNCCDSGRCRDHFRTWGL